MAVVLEWMEPAEVQLWQWQFHEQPQAKKLFRIWVKWWLLLGVPSLLAIALFAPNELMRIGGGLVSSCLYFTGIMAGLFWITHKTSIRFGIQYLVIEKGLQRRGSNATKLYQWKHIECYQIVPHSHLPGIGVLELKTAPSCPHCGPHHWAFSSAQLEEAELRGALAEYWPECASLSAATQASLPAT